MVLEREYNVPLRKEWLKVPRHKRANKAVKALRIFLARHMKAEIENIKVSKWINQELWRRGIKKPPHHIKIKAVKDDKGIVNAELAVLPQKAIEEKKAEEAKSKQKKEEKKKPEEKPAEIEGKEEGKEKEAEKKEGEDEEEKEEEKEKKEREKVLRKEIPKPKHEEMKAKKAQHVRLALEK